MIPRFHPDPFRQLFWDVYKFGNERAPRGMKTLEIEDYTYLIPPYKRLMAYPGRNLSTRYIADEIMWYLKGDRTDLSICDKAKIWKDCVTDGMIHSNYGYPIFVCRGIDYVVETLAKDEDSRRAVIPILEQRFCSLSSNDVPCTETMEFRIRDDELRCTVHMRSQDLVFGAGNDIPFFSFVQELVLTLLNAAQGDVPKELHYGMGPLVVTATSLHAYERHWPLLKDVALGHEKLVEPIEMPRIDGPEEVKLLRALRFTEAADRFKLGRWLVDGG